MVIQPKYPPVTTVFLTGVGFAFCGTVLLIISFSCPYWLESYAGAYTEFVRLGLWDVCFKDYRHPSYQYDEKFDGCHWIFSNKYQSIRDWLQPGWMMFVQAMMSISLIFCISALIMASLVLMRYFMKFEIFILICSFILELATALPVFLAVCVFGGLCFDRSWIQYPNYNHLSWAYALAVISILAHIIAGLLFLKEAFYASERRRRAHSIAYDLATKY